MFSVAAVESGAEAIEIVSLFWILAVAMVAPIVSRIARGALPEVVVLLGLGVVIGPSVLGLASAEGGVALVAELGLGMLFLLAGFEIDPDLLRSKVGRSAMVTWLMCAVLGAGLAWLVLVSEDLPAAIAVAIALSSTALGTLLPILKDQGLLDTKLGQAVLAHGASGELLPVIAMAVLLSSRNVVASIAVLLLFAVLTLLVAAVPRRALHRVPGLDLLLRERSGGTGQIVLRVVLLLLIALMALAAVFSLDVVLGAFAAGGILRYMDQELDYDRELEGKLDAVAYGFLVPVFFVVSGINISVDAVLESPAALVAVIVLIALVRGGPVWLVERLTDTGSGLQTGPERAQLALLASTGLPIIVAVTQVAVSSDLMSAETASILVAGGAMTVLIFPLASRLVQARVTSTALT
ncbi:MAG: cation:proton antiporter [Ornithinimicrobium sp.]